MSWNGNGKDNDNSRGGTSGVGEPLVSRNRHPPTKEQRLQEMKIIEEIMKLVRHKIDTSPTIREMANNATASDQNGDTTNSYKLNSEYAAERQVLMQVNNIGLREGMIAGLATFLTLRKAPGIITRYVTRRSARQQQYSSGSSSYKLDSPNPFQVSKNEAGASSKNYSKSSPGMLLLRAVRFTLDVFVSLTVGASTSFYFTDQDYMMSQMANVPLVEGRSLVADEFCTDMIQEFRKIPPEVWRDTQNPALVSVRTFVKNCQYRQSYEQKLRKDYHLQPNEPVNIPSPGVDTSYMMTKNNASTTANGNISEDDNNDFYIDGNDDNMIGEDPFASLTPSTTEYFGEEQQQPHEDQQSDNAWAESLVTDQQAQDPRNNTGKEQEKKKRWW